MDWKNGPKFLNGNGIIGGGVYAIVTSGGFVYYGKAASFKSRWASHKGNLKNSQHHNRRLQKKYKEGQDIYFQIISTESDTYEQAAIEARLIADDIYCLNRKV